MAKEWPVSYHGTKDTFAKVIAAEGYDLDKGKRFKYGKGKKFLHDVDRKYTQT